MIDMRTGTCALCAHNEIIESTPRDAWGETGTRTSAIGVVRREERQRGVPKMFVYGAIKQYTCRGCGFVQWFADNPGDVPIAEDAHTRIIHGPPKPPPYR